MTELSRRQRNIVRTLAKDAWQESNGDRDAAQSLIEERMQQKLGSVFVTIGIQLAIKLVIYWWEHRKAEPSATFQLGEPGNEEWDDA